MGEAVERRNGNDKKKGRRVRTRRQVWIRRSLITVGLVIVLIIGGVVGDYYYLGSGETGQRENTAVFRFLGEHLAHRFDEPLRAEGPKCRLRVLFHRQQRRQQRHHHDPSPGARDPHGVAAVDPRDTFVPNAREIGANKIDAALYEGPSQLVTAIEEDFAIPINNFVELNFDTFADVVNALGGIKMYFPIPSTTPTPASTSSTPGCYDLDGYHALQVVRARHLQIQPNPSNHEPHTWPYEALSDIARFAGRTSSSASSRPRSRSRSR